jgi:cellulose synthase A
LIPGSPAVDGDGEEEGDSDDVSLDFDHDLENQKLKNSERVLGSWLTPGRSGELGAPNYDKEVSHNHVLRPTSGQEVIQLVA